MVDASLSKSHPAQAKGPGIVFVGPCLAGLPEHRRKRLLEGFEVRGPVARGDILGALCLRPRLLLILDGFYYTRPSIPHKELLYALESDVQVLGAASMGALRAAELATFGMVGVGQIFEDYRDGHIDGDDEVAILHSSAEDDYRAVTVASVDVRFALQRLQRRGLLDSTASADLVDGLRSVSFDRRTPERLADLAKAHLPRAAAARLPGLLRHCRLKRRDAILALARARHLLQAGSETAGPVEGAPVENKQVGKKIKHASTLYFDYFRLWGFSLPLERSLSDLTLHRAAYLALALHPTATAWVHAWRRRFCLAWWAAQQGAAPDDGALRLRVNVLHQRFPDAGAVLPDLELRQEARQRWLADWAEDQFRSLGPEDFDADRELGQAFEELGLPSPDDASSLGRQLHGILPPWDLVRSFVFGPWLQPALDLAQVVFPLARRFAQWSQGSKVSQDQLRRTAAQRWQCPPGEVEAQGLRRGLPLGDGFAEGLWEILEAWLLTDRLRPVPPGYGDALQRLLECEPVEEAGVRSEDPAAREALGPPGSR